MNTSVYPVNKMCHYVTLNICLEYLYINQWQLRRNQVVRHSMIIVR